LICKICKKNKPTQVLDLGIQPLANKYPKYKKDFKFEKVYQLSLHLCSKCKNVQIKKLIDRKEMFQDYYYLSSVNRNLVNHFKKLAKKIKSSNFVLDIGSNDGILLKPLKDMGVKAIGIDPSINVGKLANNKGLKTLIGFFDHNAVKKIISQYGKPDTIVASSVFTHIENPNKFVKNIKKLIKKNGLFVLEVEYLSKFMKNIQYERFYFDRPFYYSLSSINYIFKSVGMSLIDVENIDIHGGSLRCYIKNTKNHPSTNIVKNIIKKEKKELTISSFKSFQKRIYAESKKLKSMLEFYKRKNKKIIGYGAPARVSTITNFANIDFSHIDYIIDDSPLKQNRFSPGKHIPIFSRKKFKNKKIDIMIVFAYEYFDQIKKNTKKYKCDYFQPIPFRVLK